MTQEKQDSWIVETEDGWLQKVYADGRTKTIGRIKPENASASPPQPAQQSQPPVVIHNMPAPVEEKGTTAKVVAAAAIGILTGGLLF